MTFLAIQIVIAIQAFVAPNMAILEGQATNPTQEGISSSNLGLVQDVNDRLDWTLSKHVAISFNGSFIFSPMGLKLTLLFLKETAAGETLKELKAIFRDDLSNEENRKKFENFTSMFEQEYSENIANLGNWVFIPKNFECRPKYQAIGETFYNTNLKTVNTKSPSETAKEINSKVSNFTLGNIINAVNEDDVIDLRILLLSTFYMKGSWLHQFKRRAIYPDHFYVSPSTQIFMPFIKTTDKFFYSESEKLDAKILRMAYLNSRFGMYLIVPNSLSGLPYVLENLSLLPSELQALEEHYVDVSLPKFKLTYTAHLDDILKEMDLSIIFENIASFPGIYKYKMLQTDQRLKISKVIQTSVIDVDEFGSGVSSKTDDSSTNNYENNIDGVREVIANRPFLFFIEDVITQQILIFGRMAGT